MNAKQCTFSLEGPKVGRNVVAWRRRCRNKTTHDTGRCWQHRREG